MKSVRVEDFRTPPLMPRSWPFESSSLKYVPPYVYRPLWGTDKPRPFPRVVQRGTMRLRDIPQSMAASYGEDGPDDARVMRNTHGTRIVYFWISRGEHTKGQVGVSTGAPWERSKERRFVDSVEAAVALAKMLGWLSDSPPQPETIR